MKMKNYLLFIGILALSILALSIVADESEARTCVWDGEGADALASNALNWDTDTAPIGGDDILFDGLNVSGDDPCTWDLDTDSFGMFTISAGYSGTITQSSDMYISGYSQAGGTFTGATTKWVYCSGDFIQDAGTITFDKLSINLTGADNALKLSNQRHYRLVMSGNYQIYGLGYFANVDLSGNIIINHGARIGIATYLSGSGYSITGSLTSVGAGHFMFLTSSGGYTLGPFNQPYCKIFFNVNGPHSPTFTLSEDIIIDSLYNFVGYGTSNMMTLNLNGHNLTATSITVGTRGILQCGEGTITTSALTSTAGTITEETATWVFTDGAIVTCTEGQKLYDVYMRGECDFVNSVNVTNNLSWIDVPSAYGNLKVYKDGVYSGILEQPYSFGPINTEGKSYTYLPLIIIKISPWYEDLDYSRYAYISSNLPVVYNITGSAAAWLSYHDGRITGLPPSTGNYTYTITGTHSSGSVSIIHGYLQIGSITEAEYSFSLIWGLLLWGIITFFMIFGYLKDIPLVMIITWVVLFGNIIVSLRIPEFEPFIVLFALCNSIIFFVGMVRWRKG